MKRLFAGTPAFAAHILEAMVAQGVRIDAVLTQPDRRAGRGLRQQPSVVKQCALRHGIRVLQPSSLSEPETIEALIKEAADLWIVVAYGQILPPRLLHQPSHGCINVHPSLLPRWRGAAPILHALLHGDTTTGVTLMRIDESLDSGPVFVTAQCSITAQDTAGTLHDRLANLGIKLLLAHLPAIENATLQALPQDVTRVTYAPQLHKTDALINWHHSAATIDRQIRAMNPWPIAYTTIRHLDRPPIALRIWQALPLALDRHTLPGTIVASDGDGIIVQCKKDGMRVLTVQAPGRKPMAIAEYIRGHPLPLGLLLG